MGVRLVGGTALAIAAAVTMASGADTADEQIGAFVKPFKGTVVLYARNLDTGRDYALGADTKVRTASTIKLPIICALASQVEAGRVKWDDRLIIRAEDKVGGSGVVRELADGTTLSVLDLATLMIVVSDNTATNLILDRISADAVNEYLDTIGLRETRALRKVRGNASSPPMAAGWSKAGELESNKRFGIGVSTPREMVRLLELLEKGSVVNPEASKTILGILRRQQYKDGIGRRTRGFDVSSKSGALDALRSDVGIVYTKAGRVAIAITVDEMPVADYTADNVGNTLIAQLALRLVEMLTGLSPAAPA